MGLFGSLLKKKNAVAIPPEQAILIYLQGTGLEDSVYQTYDTSTLDDLLTDALGGSGVVDGTETRSTETVVFLYGTNAEEMFNNIQPVLNSYPLCKTARVSIRSGPPGSTERTVQL